jgi:hypothetical protein
VVVLWLGWQVFWFTDIVDQILPGAEMGNAKREALALIQQLPDNSSLEDIQYHLYIREKVEHGLRNLKSKQTLRQKEVERRMKKRLKG